MKQVKYFLAKVFLILESASLTGYITGCTFGFIMEILTTFWRIITIPNLNFTSLNYFNEAIVWMLLLNLGICYHLFLRATNIREIIFNAFIH